jgi:ABC-type spermidine/putrescine transport system permease subunit I
MTRRNWAGPLLAAPAGVLLALFLLGPLLLLVRVSLCAEPVGGRGFYRPGTWTLAGYRDLVADGYVCEVLVFTVLLALGITALTLAVAYPLGLWLHSLPGRVRGVALACVLLPKVASALALLYGLDLLLSNSGPLNGALLALGLVEQPLRLSHNLAGVLIGETYFTVPYAVLVLLATLERIDPALVPAARGLGASRWQAFRRVTLPLSLPGLAVAGQLSLIWSLGALVGPLLLGGPEETTLAVEVQRRALEYNNWPRGAATAVLMLAAIALCVSLYALPARLTRRAA